MEKKLVTNLFNDGVVISQRPFEKKIKTLKKLNEKNIVNWFECDDKKYDVIITGGIGDFIAIEAFLFKKYYNNIGNIVLATRGHKEIIALLKVAYPELNIINLFPEFPNNFYAFIVGDDVLGYLYNNNYFNRGVIDFNGSKNDVVDFSIFKIFQLIKSGYLNFNESIFMAKNFVDIDKFGLPKNYISVVTTSNRDPIHKAMGRNLTELEIQRIADYCDQINVTGVCVYCNCVKPNSRLIHLENVTPFESIELIKNSIGYIGIDSWLSVISGYRFKGSDIKIKCFNPHGLNNRDCYYPIVKTKDLFESDFNSCLFGNPKNTKKLFK